MGRNQERRIAEIGGEGIRRFVTVDRKLSVQQDLAAFDIAVVLIRPRSNRLEEIRILVPELLGAISRATRRALTTVGKPSIERAS
jgi:hypothetical protein